MSLHPKRALYIFNNSILNYNMNNKMLPNSHPLKYGVSFKQRAHFHIQWLKPNTKDIDKEVNLKMYLEITRHLLQTYIQ